MRCLAKTKDPPRRLCFIAAWHPSMRYPEKLNRAPFRKDRSSQNPLLDSRTVCSSSARLTGPPAIRNSRGQCHHRCLQNRRSHLEKYLRPVPRARWRHRQQRRLVGDARRPQILLPGRRHRPNTSTRHRRRRRQSALPPHPNALVGSHRQRQRRHHGHQVALHRRSISAGQT